MNCHDTCRRPRGEFQARAYRRGRLFWELTEPNLVVDLADVALPKLVSGAITIADIGVGTDATAPAAGDTGLTDAVLRSLSSVSYPAAGKVAWSWRILASEANGLAIREFGLFDSTGALFARKTTAAAIDKDADVTISGTWALTWV